MKKNIQILCSTLLLFSSLTQAKEIKTQTLNNTMYNTYPIEGKILLPSNLNEYMPEPVVAKTKGTFYLGASKSYTFFVDPKNNHQDKGYSIQVGYDFKSYIGVEARYTRSYTDESRNYRLGEDLNNIALYLKPIVRVTHDFSVYGLLGYGTTHIKLDKGKAEESYPQWGVGAKYKIQKHISFFVDYTSFYLGNGFNRDISRADLSLAAFNTGFNVTF